MELPPDRPRLVPFPLQMETTPAGGRQSTEFDQRGRLLRTCVGAVEVLGRDDHHRLAALFDDALRSLRADPPEQFAEPSLCLMELPDWLTVCHAYRLD